LQGMALRRKGAAHSRPIDQVSRWLSPMRCRTKKKATAQAVVEVCWVLG
jgi:hypothetical protein